MSSLCKTNIFLIISCFVIIGICLEEEENDVIGHPVVNTKLGPVRGNNHVVLNSSVNVFLGVPYGKPPVGQLRFKHPVPADPWTGTLDCTVQPKACFQYKTSDTRVPVPETEDCLNLNVHVPGTNISTDASISNRTGLSVMVFICAGSFLRGATEWYEGSILAVTGDVILVTVSFRVGAFGYLYSGSPEAPGNAGIFDPLLALQWVHDNIEYFGGDPGSVTVFGPSTGAYTTGHLIMTPLSQNLFQRAILMGGAPIGFAALSTSIDNSFSIIEELGNITNCNPNYNATIAEIVVCLETIPAEMLDVAQESFDGYYRPVIDGYFFPKSVRDLYDEAVRKNISVFWGVTQNEGSMFVKNDTVTSKVLHDTINDLLDLRFNVTELQRYTLNYVYNNANNVEDFEANRQKSAEFIGDSMIVCPTNEFGEQLSDRNLDVYYYVFDHRPSNSPFPEWMGVVHGDDVLFAFGKPMEPENGYTVEESQFSSRFMKTFGKFAKFGVPSYEGVSWPIYDRNNHTHLVININGVTIGNDFRANYCGFWNGIIPTYN